MEQYRAAGATKTHRCLEQLWNLTFGEVDECLILQWDCESLLTVEYTCINGCTSPHHSLTVWGQLLCCAALVSSVEPNHCSSCSLLLGSLFGPALDRCCGGECVCVSVIVGEDEGGCGCARVCACVCRAGRERQAKMGQFCSGPLGSTHTSHLFSSL
jgi:hypothetical protein